MTCQSKKTKKELHGLTSSKKIRADKHIALQKLNKLKNELKETVATLLDLRSDHRLERRVEALHFEIIKKMCHGTGWKCSDH